MKATWKRWLVFFVAGAAVGLLCHLTAKENLVELGLAYDLGRTDVRIKVGPSRIDWEDVAPAILDNTHMPWPIPCEMPVRRVDLKAQSLDAEALMGLALLGPPSARGSAAEQWSDRSAWFDRLSRLAIERAHSQPQRRRLELVVVMEQLFRREWDPERLEQAMESALTSAPATSISRPESGRLYARASQLDSDNAMWLYGQAAARLEKLVIGWEEIPDRWPTLPSRSSAAEWRLAEGVTAVEAAGDVWALLKRARDLPLAAHSGYLQDLADRARALRHPGRPRGLAPASVHLTPLLGDLKYMTFRLCFLGDRLAERGQEALALEMYAGAYRAGRKLLRDRRDGEVSRESDVPLVQVLSALGCIQNARSHLAEFWAKRSSAGKVMTLRHRDFRQQRLTEQIFRYYRKRGPDPIAQNHRHFVDWVRRGALAWWLSISGMLLWAASLWMACIHLVGRRWHSLRRDGPRDDARRVTVRVSLTALLGLLSAGLGAMVVLGLLLPLPLQGKTTLAAILVWAFLLALLWPLTVGQLARSSASGQSASRRWLPAFAMGLVVLAGLLPYVTGEDVDLKPAVRAAAMAAALLLAGGVVAVVAWVARRSPPARLERARRGQAFAFSASLVAVVLLVAAFVCLLWTVPAQDEYWRRSAFVDRRWQAHALDDPLAKQLPPLPSEILELRRTPDEGATQPSAPTSPVPQ